MPIVVPDIRALSRADADTIKRLADEIERLRQQHPEQAVSAYSVARAIATVQAQS